MNHESLKALLADHQMYHSEFQMDHFITVRSGGTPYGMYKQAVRELYKRARGLRGLFTEHAKLEIDLAEKIDLQESGKSKYDRARAIVEARELRGRLDELAHNLADTEREFLHFYRQASALKKEIGELTAEKRDLLEREMWIHKMRAMAAMDYLTAGRLTQGTLELLTCVPKGLRAMLLDEVRDSNKDKLLTWMYDHEPELPKLAELPGQVSIKELVE